LEKKNRTTRDHLDIQTILIPSMWQGRSEHHCMPLDLSFFTVSQVVKPAESGGMLAAIVFTAMILSDTDRAKVLRPF